MKYTDPKMIEMLNDITNKWINYHAFDSEDFQVLLDKIWGRSLVSPDRLCILYQLAQNYKYYPAAEVGTYRGGTAFIMASAVHAPIFLFDTFEGMPETSVHDLHSKGDFNEATLEDVTNFLSGFPNINIIKGTFPDSIEINNILQPNIFGLVHLDCDIYSSVKAGLEYFYPLMVPGGTILLDDYGFRSTPGCKDAVDEFLANKKETCIGLGTGQGMIIVRS
jgi:hypothetical protein